MNPNEINISLPSFSYFHLSCSTLKTPAHNRVHKHGANLPLLCGRLTPNGAIISTEKKKRSILNGRCVTLSQLCFYFHSEKSSTSAETVAITLLGPPKR